MKLLSTSCPWVLVVYVVWNSTCNFLEDNTCIGYRIACAGLNDIHCHCDSWIGNQGDVAQRENAVIEQCRDRVFLLPVFCVANGVGT